MRHFIDTMQHELAVLEAMTSYRPRSLGLFAVALLIGPLVQILMLHLIQASELPGLRDAVRPAAGVFGLIVTLKFLFLAIRTYVKDRAALLRL